MFIKQLRELMEMYDISTGKIHAMFPELDDMALNRKIVACKAWNSAEVAKLSELFNLNPTVMESGEWSKDKMLFFDYDHTVVAHSLPRSYKCADFEHSTRELLLFGNHLYDNDVVIQPIVDYIQEKITHGVKVACLSHQDTNLRSLQNQQRLEEAFGNPIRYYTVDSGEHKVDFMRAYGYVFDIPLPHITLLDDKISTLDIAVANYINAITPTHVLTGLEGFVVQREEESPNEC